MNKCTYNTSSKSLSPYELSTPPQSSSSSEDILSWGCLPACPCSMPPSLPLFLFNFSCVHAFLRLASCARVQHQHQQDHAPPLPLFGDPPKIHHSSASFMECTTSLCIHPCLQGGHGIYWRCWEEVCERHSPWPQQHRQKVV